MDVVDPQPGAPLVAAVLRWRFAALALVTSVTAWAQHGRAGTEWRQYFVTGSELLVGIHHPYSPMPGGLRLYASRPDLQIGPLSLLVATPLRWIGTDEGLVAATVVMSVAVVALLAVLERIALDGAVSPRDRVRVQTSSLLGGLMVVAGWAELASAFTHLDDVLVMACAVLALWAVHRGRPVLLGVALGLAVAAKPWGVVFAPLVFAMPAGRRRGAITTAVALGLAAWLPFVVADRRTLDAGRAAVDLAPDSVLHLFGLGLGQAPDWVRPVQFALALALGVAAVATGRWMAVPLVGIAARVVFDPGVFPYYTSSLLLAALGWDLVQERRWPIATAVAFVGLDVVHVGVGDPGARALVRLVVCAAIVAWALGGHWVQRRRRPESATQLAT